MTDRRARIDLSLSRPQRLAATALVAALAGWLLLAGWNRTLFAEAPRVDPVLRDTVVERIDPNTATVASLRRLPGIGPGRANAIVAHRAANPPFTKPEDLDAVPNIGPATIDRLRPYLTFPIDRTPR